MEDYGGELHKDLILSAVPQGISGNNPTPQ